jgi:hypothetical protein
MQVGTALPDCNEYWLAEPQGMPELDKLGGYDHQIEHCAVDSLRGVRRDDCLKLERWWVKE